MDKYCHRTIPLNTNTAFEANALDTQVKEKEGKLKKYTGYKYI